MEEIEVSSWIILNAIKKEAKIEETVGDLQSGHLQSVFCTIEDDYLELVYSDAASNFIRKFEDREEFQLALEKQKEEVGETPYEEGAGFEEDFEDDASSESDDINEEPEI